MSVFKNILKLQSLQSVQRSGNFLLFLENSSKLCKIQNLRVFSSSANYKNQNRSQITESERRSLFETRRTGESGHILEVAERYLGRERYSRESGLITSFGRFQEIINLFLLKVTDVPHPILYLSKIVENELSKDKDEGEGGDVRINSYPLWKSMMILLATEMFGVSKEMNESSPEILNFMHERHNRVAKIVEISHIAQIIHSGILDLDFDNPNSPLQNQMEMNEKERRIFMNEMNRANKAATLIGDLLLTQKCVHMAALKSSYATEVICNTLGDYCESEFVAVAESESENSLGGGIPFSYGDWLKKTQLGVGSILSNMIGLNLYFSGFDKRIAQDGFALGTLFGLFLQAYNDIQFFARPNLENPSWLPNLKLLPIAIKAQTDPEMLTKSHSEIFEMVKKDERVMEESLEIFSDFQSQSLSYISKFEKMDKSGTSAKEILSAFIKSLKPTL